MTYFPNEAKRIARLAGALLGSATVLALAHTAAAQQVTGEFSVQRMNPAPGPNNMISARGVRTGAQLAWGVGMVTNYGNQPFVVVNSTTGQEIRVVENLVTGDLMGSFNPVERLQLGLRVPLNYVEGDNIDAAGNPLFTGGFKDFTLGDPELEAKVRLHGELKDPFAVGAAAFIRAPIGSMSKAGRFVGDHRTDFGLRAIFDGAQGPLSVLGNVSYIFRGDGSVGKTDIGGEMGYNLGVGFAFSPVFKLLAEGFGATEFNTQSGANNLEAGGALQISPPGTPILISAGGSAGIIKGIGTPNGRVLVGFSVFIEQTDKDGDGIDDDKDQCSTVAEDRDGYEDDDGCPESDNDGDTIQDDADKCPNDSEDPDGFEDLDGCAEADNDKDGLADANDRCPLQPETKNGFRDEDGCPDVPDSDADGVSDTDDKCPETAEDTDGFQDEDGCPDLDNDADGVPDSMDECVDQPETKNGNKDEDGCPD